MFPIPMVRSNLQGVALDLLREATSFAAWPKKISHAARANFDACHGQSAEIRVTEQER
jgi:hypothetical protein